MKPKYCLTYEVYTKTSEKPVYTTELKRSEHSAFSTTVEKLFALLPHVKKLPVRFTDLNEPVLVVPLPIDNLFQMTKMGSVRSASDSHGAVAHYTTDGNDYGMGNAICGDAPSGRSCGWSSWTSDSLCPKCFKIALEHDLLGKVKRKENHKFNGLLLSQKSLSKVWDTPEEDVAWATL